MLGHLCPVLGCSLLQPEKPSCLTEIQHHLVHLTVRLVALSTWLYDVHHVIFFENIDFSIPRRFRMDGSLIGSRLSDVARLNILLIAADGYEATQIDIARTVDDLSVLKSHNQNSIIFGLCMRRIALLYRDALKRYMSFGTSCKSI
jgi:hypothetical protein